MDRLLCTQGALEALTVPLDRAAVVIGRLEGDVILPDPEVSGRHARVVKSGEAYLVEDLGSLNGTYVDGVRTDRQPLGDGAMLQIGTHFFRVILDSARVTRVHRRTPLSDAEPEDLMTIDARAQADSIVRPADGNQQAFARARNDLEAVYRVGQTIHSLLATDDIYAKLLEILFDEFPAADTISVHEIDGETGELIYRGHRARDEDLAEEPTCSWTIYRLVLEEGRAVLSFDAARDERLGNAQTIIAQNIRSSLCAPLQSGGAAMGLVQVNSLNRKRCFSQDDLRLLTAIGTEAGAALANARLYERLAAEKGALAEANARLQAAQAQLVQTEKLAALGQLSAGIVHDIKNPITVMLGTAQYVRELLEANGIRSVAGCDVLDSLRNIEQAVVHCNEIINNMLQFARKTEPAKTAMQVNDTLTHLVRFLKHEVEKASADVRVDLDSGLPPIVADPHQIQEVFFNIIVNALQSRPECGVVNIRTAAETAGDARFVAVTVADNGAGMPPEVLQRIFEPFYTTKKYGDGMGGTGLGLSVAYGIVHDHGGRIDVTSEPGKGSSFTVRLPCP